MPNQSKIRFGVFELYAASGELLKDGRRVRLQEQPFQVLKALIERPGQIVSRDELQQLLWPNDTFVDFEDGLSTAVKKVRQALGDSATNPRFIETLPKRGYRFIAPVEGDAPKKDRAEHIRLRRLLVMGAAVPLLLMIGWVVTDEPVSGPLATERIVPLASQHGAERHPAFSPDGRQIAYSWAGLDQDNLDIYVKLVGEQDTMRLTIDPERDYSPVWSPDGRKIIFSRYFEDGRAALYEISALGGPERKVLDLPYVARARKPFFAQFQNLDWSPDGRFLAFGFSNAPDGSNGLFLYSLEDGKHRRLTKPPEGFRADWNPSFSNDGQAIAFLRMNTSALSDIYIVPLRGGDPERIARVNKLIFDLDWTANDREIIFSAGDLDTGRLFRVPVAGGALRRVLGAVTGVWGLDIAREGRELAYVHQRKDDSFRFAKLDGGSQLVSEPKTLAGSSQHEATPRFSSDGNRIVFRSERSGSLEIWISDVDGSNAVQLTSFGGPIVGGPRWSPDDRTIAFGYRGDEKGDIYLVDVESHATRRFTDHPAAEDRPSWSRDGNYVYFSSDRSGVFNVWKKPVHGGSAVQLTYDGGREVRDSVDGKIVYYHKGSANEIWKVPAEGGEEAFVLGNVTPIFWTLSNAGLYFWERRDQETAGLNFYRFETGDLEPVAVETNVRRWGRGGPVDVTRDGRSLLYQVTDYQETDLMLVENFE